MRNSPYMAPEADPLVLQHDYMDPESLEFDAKQAREIRHGFIRKVYGILLAQVALTTVIGAFFTMNDAWRIWIVTSGSWLPLIAAIASIGLICGLSCVPGVTERHPTNLYLLFAFTGCQALTLGAVCAVVAATRGQSVVLQAFVCTLFMVAGLTAFAMQTKWDFTLYSGVMFVALLGLMGLGLIRLIFPYSGFLETLYAVGGALIFSGYIVIDTQLLVGGKTLTVSEDQYVMISLALYIDIINLFVNILQLLSRSSDDN